MTAIEFVLLLLVAGVCGGLAQALVGYSHGGCLVSIALGFIGALLGTWLVSRENKPDAPAKKRAISVWTPKRFPGIPRWRFGLVCELRSKCATSKLARQLKLPELLTMTIADQQFPVIWSIIGGALFAAVLSLLSRRPRPVV